MSMEVSAYVYSMRCPVLTKCLHAWFACDAKLAAMRCTDVADRARMMGPFASSHRGCDSMGLSAMQYPLLTYHMAPICYAMPGIRA
eukprot:2853675-Rhodomonas_salina.2